MERYVRGGQWQKAISLLTTVESKGGELSSGAYQAAISACARAEPPAWRAALHMLERCRTRDTGSLASEKVYGAAIHACRAEWLTALALLQQMTQRDGLGLNQYATTATIKALGAAGQWRRALDVFREFVSQTANGHEAPSGNYGDRRIVSMPQLDTALVQATMMACAEAGRVNEARGLLKYVEGRSLSAEDSSAFDHAIAVALANSGRPAEALELLRWRRSNGLAVTSRTYNALLRSARQACAPDLGLAIFADLSESGVPLSDTSYVIGLGPALQRDASWRSALRLVSRLFATRKRLPSVRAQSDLLKACADGGQAAAAEALLQLLSDCGAADERTMPRLCSEALRACARARTTPAAAPATAERILDLLEEVSQSGKGEPTSSVADAYSLAINSCPPWAWETALRLWERMANAGVEPDLAAACSLLRALRRGARWDESVSFLSTLRESASPVYGTQDDSAFAELLGIVTGACENAGAWQPALDAQRQLPGPKRSKRKERALALLARLAEESASSSSLDEELALARSDIGTPASGRVANGPARAGGDVGRAKDAPLDSVTLEDVNGALGLTALGGQWSDAMRLMRSLRRCRPPVTPSPMTFSLLISAAERGRQWALLLRLHGTLSRDGLWRRSGRPNEAAYDSVAAQAAVRANCALGNWRAALLLLDSMEQSGVRPQGSTCEQVLVCMAQAATTDAGACDAAEGLLQRMLRDGPAPGRTGFEAVVNALARRGRIAQCREAMRDMQRIGDIAMEMSTLAAAYGGLLSAARQHRRALGRRAPAEGSYQQSSARLGTLPSGESEAACEVPVPMANVFGPMEEAQNVGTAPSFEERMSPAALLAACRLLHNDAEAQGLLSEISDSLADVRGLPNAVAVGKVLATLDHIDEPLRVASEPLMRTWNFRAPYQAEASLTSAATSPGLVSTAPTSTDATSAVASNMPRGAAPSHPFPHLSFLAPLGPLIIRTDTEPDSQTLERIREALLRFCRVGGRPVLRLAAPGTTRGGPSVDTEREGQGASSKPPLEFEELGGRDVALTARSLRSWVQARRRRSARPAGATRRLGSGGSGGRSGSDHYWRRSGSALPDRAGNAGGDRQKQRQRRDRDRDRERGA